MSDEHKDQVENLSVVDLDVDALEKRLELAVGHHMHPDGYYCFNDCYGYRQPSPQ